MVNGAGFGTEKSVAANNAAHNIKTHFSLLGGASTFYFGTKALALSTDDRPAFYQQITQRHKAIKEREYQGRGTVVLAANLDMDEMVALAQAPEGIAYRSISQGGGGRIMDRLESSSANSDSPS